MLRLHTPQLAIRNFLSLKALGGSLNAHASTYTRHISSATFIRSKPELKTNELKCFYSTQSLSNKKCDVDGETLARRVILPSHETSLPHLNVLKLLKPPRDEVDLLPTLSKSEINSIPGLFQSKEFEKAAVKLLDQITELGTHPSWPDLEKKFPGLEIQLTRAQELKSGDKVVVIGGGISGLTLAWFLGISRPDLQITVLESKDRTGGWMESVKVNLQKDGEGQDAVEYLEWGPRTLQATHAGSSLIRIMLNKMGVLEERMKGVPKSSPSNQKGIIFKKKLVPLPSSLLDLMTFVLRPITRGTEIAPFKDFLMGPRKPEVRDESVESYISRRFGATVATRFISAIMRVIYSADISILSARSVALIGKPYSLEHETPSMVRAMITGRGRGAESYAAKAHVALLHALVDLPYENSLSEMSKYSLCTFNEGISTLPKLIENDLAENFENVKIVKNAAVSEISSINNGEAVSVKSKQKTDVKDIEAQWVVSTMPAYSLADAFKSTEPELSTQTNSLASFSTVAVVNVIIPKKFVGKNWFGYLVPKEEDKRGLNPNGLLGAVFNTAVQNGARDLHRIPITQAENKKDIDNKRDDKPILKSVDFKLQGKTDLTDAPLIDKNGNKIVGDAPLPSHGIVSLMFGGSSWADKSLDELPTTEELVAATKDVFRSHLQTDLDQEQNVDIQVKMQYNCIPIYGVGHQERKQALKDQVSEKFNNRLTLTGLSFGKGAGIGDHVVDSFWLAVRHTPERKLLYPESYLNQWLALNYPSLMK